MPLAPIPIPGNLITKTHGATGVTLNRQQYPELQIVEGEPALSARNPAFDAALREAFAALCVVRKLAPGGTRQRVFLGEAAIRLIYGRAKREEEKDCDVVGYGLSGKDYGYWLAEGKGDDLEGAVQQFEAVRPHLETRRHNPADDRDPRAGLIYGSLIVTNRLRYLEWNERRKLWIALNGALELPVVTARLQPNIARVRPTLQQDKVYLIDGPEGPDNLPLWALTPGIQPWPIFVHERLGRDRGQFRPLRIGAGGLEVYFVR